MSMYLPLQINRFSNILPLFNNDAWELLLREWRRIQHHLHDVNICFGQAHSNCGMYEEWWQNWGMGKEHEIKMKYKYLGVDDK